MDVNQGKAIIGIIFTLITLQAVFKIFLPVFENPSDVESTLEKTSKAVGKYAEYEANKAIRKATFIEKGANFLQAVITPTTITLFLILFAIYTFLTRSGGLL
jgi:hypothetical protein